MNHTVFSKRTFLKAAAGALAYSLAPDGMTATRPPGLPDTIRFIVPFGAGGVLDGLARQVADFLRTAEGLTVLVENRPGAGGNIAAEYVANSKPDGSTLFFAVSNVMPGNGVLYPALRYDAQKAFVCLSQLCSIQTMLAVRSDLKVDDMKAFVKRATSTTEPPLTIGSIGLGSSNHIAQAIFLKYHKANLTHVPYKGEPAIVQDMLSGLIDCSMLSAQACGEHVKSGKLRLLAINGTVRNSMFPNVPTYRELGFQEWFWSNPAPQAVFAPSNVNQAVAQYLGTVITSSLQTDQLKDYLRNTGALSVGVPYPQAQERYEVFANAYREAVRLTGVKLD